MPVHWRSHFVGICISKAMGPRVLYDEKEDEFVRRPEYSLTLVCVDKEDSLTF